MKRKLSISVRFFLMFVFSLIAIGIFSLFVSMYFSRILVEKEYDSFRTLTSSFLAQTENEVRIMDEVSIDLFYSMLVQDNFIGYLQEPGNRVDRFSRLIELFVAVNGANFSLPLIALYSEEGDRVLMSAYSGRDKVDMQSLDWLNDVQRQRYRKVLSRPHTSDVIQMSRSTKPYYISLYRAFRDSDGNDIGYIETAQFTKAIFDSIIAFRKQRNQDLKVFVFDSEGVPIYPYEPDTMDSALMAFYYDSAETVGPVREFTNLSTGDKELFYAERSSYTDWTYVCVQGIDSILHPVRKVSRILIFATSVLFFVVSFISALMSRSITRPIRDLNRKFHSINLETLSGETKHLRSAYDEFDELNDAFHSMSEKLKKSMDELLHSRQQEMESRYLALQSQINPHFYYNSLSSIVALTEENRVDEIVRFCDTLSDFMRYSAHQQTGTVPLSTELDYAEKYLYCMKVRYQSSLSYSVRVDPSLADVQVPKLVVQPLVENAVKYGTDCEPPWNIDVTASRSAGQWSITVRDMGPGFAPRALEEFHRMKSVRDGLDIAASPASEDPLGLINVYFRWKLFCGTAFVFDIASGPEGSTVTIGRTSEADLRG